ncbi:sigma-70 family RNA polymerase sigma factor [Nocardia sp. NPDC019304]|uniref:sigma-70 family RNA polymerase sigma factor n=1 Tax=unclassified Nocardia TaxID=2637762 RepID=UPI0033DF549E
MVQIPDSFPGWLTDMVLGHFPEGDPEGMRRDGDAWSDAANALAPVRHRLQAALERLDKAVEGEAGAEMQKQYRKVLDQIQAQIEFNNAMARQLYDNATAIEYEQYVIVGIAAALLAQVIIDMAMPPPGSIVKAISDRAEARVGMELARRDLVVAILGKAARFVAEHPRLMLATKGVFFGTAIGGGVPYVAQRVQMAQGHREKIDWQKVGIGAAAGAAGGLVGVEVGRRVAPFAIKAGGRVLGTVAAGGVGGMAGGLAGGLTAWGLTGGELRGKDLATMVWTGFGSGLVGSVGASVRAGRAGANTNLSEPVPALDSSLPPDAAPPARISAPGDGRPPQLRTAAPEPTSTTSEVDAPPARRAESGDGSMDPPDDLSPEMMAAGDEIVRNMVDDAIARIMAGEDPGPLSDGTGGTTFGSAPDHPSGGSSPSSPSSSGHGGAPPAWRDTAIARTPVAVAAHPEGGPVTPMPSRQFQISDPQVRPDQRVDLIADGTLTQPETPALGPEVLFDDGSSSYTSPFMIEHGPAGEMYLLAPEQMAGNPAQDTAGPRPVGGTLEEGATTQDGQPLHHIDFDAEIARLEAELAQNTPPSSADATASSVEAPLQGADTTPSAAGTDDVAGHAQSVADAPPITSGTDGHDAVPQAGAPSPTADPAPSGPFSATPEPPNPVAHAGSPSPRTDPAATGHATPGPRNPVAPSNPPQSAAPTTTSGASPTGEPRPPLGHTPPSGSRSTGPHTAPLAAAAPDAHSPAAHASTPTSSATPTTPTAATAQPDADDEPAADPDEFPTPPGTVVDDPREHNVQKDPREYSVQQDPRDHNVQKKPSGDYITIPGVSYPLEDEPPADAIPVIPRTPALTPLPNDSVDLGRAFQNPDDPENTSGPTSSRAPDITNPLSDRHLAAPETGLDAGLGKTPDSLTMPSRYATEPSPDAPGAPQKPAAPQLNPHSLEYSEDPSRLPAIGGVPPLLPAPPPKKTEPKRLVTRMGADPEEPEQRKRPRKQQPPPPPPPQPTPEPPVPTPTPKPVPRPKPRKRPQPSAPLVREEFVVREDSEAIGAIGEEGERVRGAAGTRRWVRSLPQKLPWLSEDQIDTAELLLSEVVANSLRWTQGKVAVIATATDTDDTRKTRFTVTDDSEVVPERTGMPDWDAERGRGGEFVAMLSDAHGATVHENGKSTWFELHGPRGDDPASPSPDNAETAGIAETPASAVDTTPTRDQPTAIEFVVRAQGPDPRAEAARMRAGSQAWDQLSDQLFDWPADKIDDAGLELAEHVMITLENSDDGSVRVALEESGDPGERLLRVTVGDSSFEVREAHELPQWLADAIEPVRHLRLNVPGQLAIAVRYRDIPKIARALAPLNHLGIPADVAQDGIDRGLRHRARINRGRLHASLRNVMAEPTVYRSGDSVVELDIYPFWDQDFRSGLSQLDLTGRNDRMLPLGEFVDAIITELEQRRQAFEPQNSVHSAEASENVPAPEVRSTTDSAERPASNDASAQAVPIPRPEGADTTAWLSAVRRYSGLSPGELDELVGATPGTWQAAELGETDLETAHVRALLRRILPEGHTIYTDVAAHYPGLLSRWGKKIFPEGYARIGEYIRFLRESNGLTQAQMAQLLGKSKSTVEVWERGTRSPAKKMITAMLEKLRYTYGVTVDEITETFSYLPREAPVFPNPGVARSFGEYLKIFRSLNNLQPADAARILGYTAETIRSHEAGETARSEELEMLAAYDRVLHRAGPWNDLAEAWGYSYRMNPAGETFPDPADYRTVHEWMKALRLHQRMTQEQFAERVGRSKRGLVYAESRSRPGLRFLRELRDTLEMPNDTLVSALRLYYARPGVEPIDETDEALFWELIATPVGSAEEESVRNRIIERYAWVAPIATRYWRIPDQQREDLIQIANIAILQAVTNFVPLTGNFASFAASHARHAMLDTLYDYRYPGITDRDTRNLLGKIDRYRDEQYRETARYPADSEVAEVLGIATAEVTSARALAGRPTRLDAPTRADSKSDQYDVAIPAQEPAQDTDSEPAELSFTTERLTEAWDSLSELPEGDLAQEILRLQFLDDAELSLAQVSERLGIPLTKAQQLMAAAMERLRTALPVAADRAAAEQDANNDENTSRADAPDQPKRSGGSEQTPGPTVSFQDVDPFGLPARNRRFGRVAGPDPRVFHHDENDPLARPYGHAVPPTPGAAEDEHASDPPAQPGWTQPDSPVGDAESVAQSAESLPFADQGDEIGDDVPGPVAIDDLLADLPEASRLLGHAVQQRQPVDWQALTRDTQILLLGEDHSNISGRVFLERQAAALRRAGVTHFGIEAPPHPAIDAVNAGIPMDLSGVELGPARDGYLGLVWAMSAQGIKIVPFDVRIPGSEHGSPLRDIRESHITKTISQIVAEDPDAIIAVQIGMDHITEDQEIWQRTTGTSGMPLHARLREAGFTTKSISIWGGDTGQDGPINGIVERLDLQDQTFIADLQEFRRAGGKFPRWGSDFLLHLGNTDSFWLPDADREIVGWGPAVRLTASQQDAYIAQFTPAPEPEFDWQYRPHEPPQGHAEETTEIHLTVPHRSQRNALSGQILEGDVRAFVDDWANDDHARSFIKLTLDLAAMYTGLTDGAEITAAKTGTPGRRIMRVEITGSDGEPSVQIPDFAKIYTLSKLHLMTHRYGQSDGETATWFEFDESGPDFSMAGLRAVHGTPIPVTARGVGTGTTEQPEITHDVDGRPTVDSRVPEFRRPSDEAMELWQRILDAEQAGDPRARELRAEAQRLIPDDGERAYAERYVGNERRAAALAQELGITADELRALMTAELRRAFSGDIVIRVRAMTLHKVIDSRRFKTVFETAARSVIGRVQLERRAELERELFGYALDLAAESRPVYARVRTTRGSWEHEGEVADEYGGVDVVLKSAVASRTTASVGSPWGVKAIPSSVTDPQPESFAATPSHHGELAYFGLEGIDRDYAGERFLRNSYIEAQIHGGVTIADIDHVVFHREPPDDRLETALAEAGIPWSMASDYSGNPRGPSSQRPSDNSDRPPSAAESGATSKPGPTPWQQTRAPGARIPQPPTAAPANGPVRPDDALDVHRPDRNGARRTDPGMMNAFGDKVDPKAWAFKKPGRGGEPDRTPDGTVVRTTGSPTAPNDSGRRVPDSPALVRAARNGDSVAFDRLRADLAEPIVQWMAARVDGDRAAAEGLTDEVFARAAARIGQLREGQDIKQWLGVIARNVLVEQQRYERLRDGIWASYVGSRNTASGPRGGLLAKADRATVLRAVRQLPPDHRKVLVWRFEQGKSATQIAESMPSSWGSRTVRKLERRAAQRVVEVVAGELGVVAGGRSAERQQQWRTVQEADPAELERHIPMLPERQREIAALLLLRTAPPGKAAKALDTSPRRLKATLHQEIVPALATLLTGGVLLTDHEAVMLTRAAQRHDTAVLAPYVRGLDPLYQNTFEQFFIQRRTVNEMAAAQGIKPKTIYMRVYRVAQFLAQKVPAELRESYTSRGLLQTATTSDVAREAGVSQSTAEKVLRGAGGFAPETKRRVLEAADRQGVTFVQREGVAPPLRVVGPADQYRYMGGDSGYRMTRYEAHVLFEAAVRSGNPTVGDFIVRIPDASAADGGPLFPEHRLWQMMPPHVQRFRKVLHLLTDVRLPDGRVLDSSTPALIEQRPPGAVVSDFQFDRLRAMVLRSIEGLRRALGEVPVEPLRQWLPGFPEDRDTEGFLRFLADEWTDQFSRYRQAGWAEMFTDLEIPGRDPLAAVLESAIFMIPARFEVLHGSLGREHIRIDRGRIAAITGWAGALIGDPALDWAWLNHRGAGDYVPSRLRPPNMPIYASLLHVRRAVHGAVELVSQPRPDPHRIAEYATSYAIARRFWGLPARDSASLEDIFDAHRRRLSTEDAPAQESRGEQRRQTPWSGAASSSRPGTAPLAQDKPSSPTPWKRTTAGGGRGSDGTHPGPEVNFHDIVDERAALDLPPVRQRRRPFGHMRGLPGLDPALAFHHNPDDGREWGTPGDRTEAEPQHEISEVPDEQRLAEQDRPAAGPGPREGLIDATSASAAAVSSTTGSPADGPRKRAKPMGDIGILPREVEVLDMTLQGLSRNEIAERLGLRPETVTNYRASAAKKLGTVGVIATVVEAKRWGLLTDTGTEESTLFTVSDEDRKLLQLLAEGKTAQQIARERKVTPETVERHSARIGAELGAPGQLPMVMKAIRLGIVTVDNGGIVTEAREHSPSHHAPNGSIGEVTTEPTGQPILRQVLPADVHTAEILDSGRSPALTVRLAAEQLLGDLGLQNEPLPSWPTGKPRWPADLVGDTAGTGRYAAVAAAPGQMYRAIGLDAKDHEPVSRAAIPSITRHRERSHLRELSSAHPGIYWTQVLASAKDNAIDVQSGLTETELSHNEIEVVLRPDPAHPDSGSFEVLPVIAGSDASTSPLFSGRFRVSGSTVLTAIAVRRASDASEAPDELDSADPPAPAKQPEASTTGVPEPAAPRPAGLIGDVPDLVNPFDDRGAPWDRGGPVPRHKRIERIAETHIDGGGFTRGGKAGSELPVAEDRSAKPRATTPAGEDAPDTGEPSGPAAQVPAAWLTEQLRKAAVRARERAWHTLRERTAGLPFGPDDVLSGAYRRYLDDPAALQEFKAATADVGHTDRMSLIAILEQAAAKHRAAGAPITVDPGQLTVPEVPTIAYPEDLTPAEAGSIVADVIETQLLGRQAIWASGKLPLEFHGFDRWALTATPDSRPPAVTVNNMMNCIKLPLYGGVLAQVLDRGYLQSYIRFEWWNTIAVPQASGTAMQWQDGTEITAEEVGQHGNLSLLFLAPHGVHEYHADRPNTILPHRGDLVFFDGLGHVAVATGRLGVDGSPEVFTFWPYRSWPMVETVRVSTVDAEAAQLSRSGNPTAPDDDDSVRVEFGPGPWGRGGRRYEPELQDWLRSHTSDTAAVPEREPRAAAAIAAFEAARDQPRSDDAPANPAPARTNMIGNVPDLVNPLDDRGAPWDRGGRVPRHQRTDRLAEPHIDGGGFARGNRPDPQNPPSAGVVRNQVRYSDLLFNPSPDEAAAAAVRDLPTTAGPLGPELNLDFLPFFASDGLTTDEDVETVATAVGDMLREHNWRDTAQIEAAAELVRAAGLNAVRYMTSYTRALQRAGVSQWDEERALHGIKAKLMLRLSTQADARSLYMALEIEQYRPERSPDDELFTWHAPLFSDVQVEAGVRTLLDSATVSDVEQWGEIWARFDEPRSDADGAVDEPPPQGDLAAKSRIVRKLYDDHHIRIVGWEDSVVPAQAVESVDRALRDRIAEYGSRFALRDVTFDDIEEFGLTRSFGTTTPDAKDHYTSITVNRRIFTDPEVRREWAEQVSNHRYAESAEDLIYQLIHHEFIHVVVDDGNWMLHAPAMALLRSAYALYRDSELIPADVEFTEWLALLPTYALLSDPHSETATFNPVEGVPEGARAGAVGSSSTLTDPARILHWLTVTRDGSSPAPTLAQWAKRQAAVVGEGRSVLLLLHDFRDVTGRADIEVPAGLRPQDSAADVLETATGHKLRHFTDVGEVITQLRAWDHSPDSHRDGVSALVVEDGRSYLLVRRATESGTARIEVRNPGEGVLRANHHLPLGSPELPGVRAMFFDENGRPAPNDGTRPDAGPPAGEPPEPQVAEEPPTTATAGPHSNRGDDSTAATTDPHTGADRTGPENPAATTRSPGPAPPRALYQPSVAEATMAARRLITDVEFPDKGNTSSVVRKMRSSDGEINIYKPEAGANKEAESVNPELDTYTANEVAAYRFSEIVGFGRIPATARTEGVIGPEDSSGPGMIQQFVVSTPGEAIDKYSVVQQQQVAVIDATIGQSDRRGNWRTVKRGVQRDLLAIDHAWSFPVSADPFDIDIDSPFVAAHQGEQHPLEPEVLDAMRAVDIDHMRAAFEDAGLHHGSVEGALARFVRIRELGYIPDDLRIIADDPVGAGGDLHHGKTVRLEHNSDRSEAELGADRSAELLEDAVGGPQDRSGVEVLRSGTAVEVAVWLRRTWRVELSGFDEQERARDVARGIDHMFTEYRKLSARSGAVVAVGRVGGGKGIHVAVHRDESGQIFIDSMTVDPRLLGSASESAGEQLYGSIVGAIGAVLVDAGVGVVRERAFDYLYSHYLGSRPDRNGDQDTAFEDWLRGQLGDSVFEPRSRIHLRRRSLSSRFDVWQAARAAVAEVEVNGRGNASDAARTLHRLLFAQLRSDPTSLDLLQTALPEVARHARIQWGRGSENARDLAATFAAERGIPVIGADFSDADGKKVRALFRGLHAIWDVFPDVEIRSVTFRSMNLSIRAMQGEDPKEIVFNREYLRNEYPTDRVAGFRYGVHRTHDEAMYRFATVMVADAGSAILDDVFPALLTRWLQGKASGQHGYEKDFGPWLGSQFSRFSRRAAQRDDDKSPHRYLYLDEEAALAESVVEVVRTEEPTDGQRVLYALLMKHLTPERRAASESADRSQPEQARRDANASGLSDTAESGTGLILEAVPHTELTAALATYGDTGGGWTGADSTYSRRLPDGRQLWMFSDTFLGTVHPDGSRPATSPMVKNTFVVDDRGRMSTVHGGTADAPTAVVPAPEGQMFWVGGGYVTGNVLNVMLVRFVNTDPDDLMWGISWKENRLARFDAENLGLIDLTPMPSRTGVMWSAWLDYDGTHTYVYGTKDSGGDKYMHVARVLGDDLRAPWEFFDGEGWSPEESDSAPLLSGVANEYSVTRWRDRYLLITQDTSVPFSAEIRAYLSDAPTGPFTTPTVVYRAPEAGIDGTYGDRNVYAYNAHEHPDLRSGDTLIVSYNVNSLDFEGVIGDVSKYRPRFITVRLNPGFGSGTDPAGRTPGPETDRPGRPNDDVVSPDAGADDSNVRSAPGRAPGATARPRVETTPPGQRFDPGMLHAFGPNVGPDAHAFVRPGRQPRPSFDVRPLAAADSTAARASRTGGNGGQPAGRGFTSGGIRTSPAGLIVPADPTDSLIVPAAYVIPADPSLEELMERLRPWKEIFHYFWEFPMPREGELSGRAWIESAERKAWMRRRALRRTPLYAGVDAAVRLTLAAERLLGAPNATPGPATIEQRRVIPGRGPIDAGKNRTMRHDTQVREASPANAEERTPFGRFWAAVSGDELPQTKLIRQGKMAYNGGRLLRAEGHNLMVAGRYAEGYELLVSGRDPVLTPEEYALWLMFNHDALWTLHFPGCRELEPQSPEFLLTRYLTIAIFDKIATKPLEVRYLDDVVRPYLRRQGVAAGRVLLHDLTHYLPESCRTTTERLGAWALRGLGRRVGAEVKEHLDNCAACRNTAALLPAAHSSSGERKLLVPPGPAGDGATPHTANRPAPPADPRVLGHGQRIAQRAEEIRPGTYPQVVFDPATALDLPPQRARGLDGLGFGPAPAVADPFRGLPDGVVAHAAHPDDPAGGAFGGGRSERIARAALSNFRVDATFSDLKDWAARLTDDNLHQLLTGFTRTVTELISAIHRGDPPTLTDQVINPARLLGAIVAEATRRFGDSVPTTTPTTYRELFATAPWLRASRRTVSDLHAAMTAVLDAAFAVIARPVRTAGRWLPCTIRSQRISRR